MKKARAWRTAFVLTCSFITVAWAVSDWAGQGALSAYLPADGAAPGWIKDSGSQEFAGDDLYTYIDGGAEIYQEFGFRRVIVQDYRHASGRSVSLEIFEMETPAAAYGMFTFKRSGKGKIVALGAGGELEDYYLNFWKGKFLVTLTGFDETAGTIEGILAIGGAVDAKIPDRAGIPGLVSALPEQGLRPESIKYLKGLLGLNNVYPFYTARGLNFREAVVAEYGDGATLLVLDYGTAEALEQAAGQLGPYLAGSERFKKLSGNALEIATLILTDGKGRYVALRDSTTRLYVAIAPDRESLDDIIRRAKGLGR